MEAEHEGEAAAREAISKGLVMYGTLPSYRAMLDKEGAAGPADIAIVGNAETVSDQIKRLADMHAKSG